jgi:hypothetical protein
VRPRRQGLGLLCGPSTSPLDRTVMRVTLALLAAFGLSAPPFAVADPPLPPGGSAAATNAPRLSQSEAIRIASDVVKRMKYDLRNLKPPQATFSRASGRGRWSVYFETKEAILDGCFWILIDDTTGEVDPNIQMCG